MRPRDPVNDPPSSLWGHVKEGLRRQHVRRPVSFYLMLAIIVVLLLGLQMAGYREAPRRFFLVLSAMFVFFFVVVWLAVVEFMDILRRGYREERELYRNTLGNPEFAEELGKRVARHPEDGRESEEPGQSPDD